MGLYDYITRVKSEKKDEEKNFEINYYSIDNYNISQFKKDMMAEVYTYVSPMIFKSSLERFVYDFHSEIYLQRRTTTFTGTAECLVGIKNYDTEDEESMSYEEFNKLYSKSLVYGTQKYAIMNFKEGKHTYPIIFFSDGRIFVEKETAVLIRNLTDDQFGMALASECVKWDEESKELLDPQLKKTLH